MPKYLIVNSCNINWSLSIYAPNKHKFKSLRNFSLLNPKTYYKGYSDHGLIAGRPTLIQGQVIFYTQGLILEYKEKDVIDYNILFEFVRDFLRYLRFESKQVSINPLLGISSIMTVENISEEINRLMRPV